MPKFYGKIGYSQKPVQESPGKWTDEIKEQVYRGDILQIYHRNESADKINDDITISNRISILADPFALTNFQNMKYVIWNDQYWKIKTIEVSRPRLILSIGGIYNGPRPAESS